MLPFVLTKIFSFKKNLLQMIFYFLFKEDYIANTTSAGKQRTFHRFITCQIQISSLWLTPARLPLSLPPISPMGVWQVGSCLQSCLIRRLSDMLPAHCLLRRVAALVFGQQGFELELPQ